MNIVDCYLVFSGGICPSEYLWCDGDGLHLVILDRLLFVIREAWPLLFSIIPVTILIETVLTRHYC
jgi:hypothetical protein